jgi:hypothetical protein
MPDVPQDDATEKGASPTPSDGSPDQAGGSDGGGNGKPHNGIEASEDDDAPAADHAGKPERKAAMRKRRSSRRKRAERDRKKSDRRFALGTAAISATAAIMGAMAGGFFSYKGAEEQSNAHADAATLTRKQTIYSDYIAQLVDYTDAENTVVDVLQSYNDNYATGEAYKINLNSYVDKSTAAFEKTAHSQYIVSLNDSDAVDTVRGRISDTVTAIRFELRGQVGRAYKNEFVDPAWLERTRQNIKAVQSDFANFTKAARDELKLPNHGFFSWL